MDKTLSKNRYWLLLLSMVLVFQVVGCAKKPDPNQRVGSDRFGYLTIPSDWEESTTGTSGIETAAYYESSYKLIITVMVYTAVDLPMAQDNMKRYFTSEGIELSEEVVTSLDSGTLNPVFKTRCYIPASNTYMALYLFNGPDGLARYIGVAATGDDLVEVGIKIVESSYSFTE